MVLAVEDVVVEDFVVEGTRAVDEVVVVEELVVVVGAEPCGVREYIR